MWYLLVYLDADVRADKHSWSFGDLDYPEANLAPLTGIVGAIQVSKCRLAAEQMDTRVEGHCTLDLALALSQANRWQGACDAEVITIPGMENGKISTVELCLFREESWLSMML